MQTRSALIQSLCVPCCNKCRYCLLSWSDRTLGADWERSVKAAERLINELREKRPKLDCAFSFGYSMEHKNLREAICTLRRLGSPTAEFMQCDGMKMRDEKQCGELMALLRGEGVKSLNFTIYGLRDYHDHFAGRSGDFDLLLRMMKAAREAGMPFSTGVPLTSENVDEIDELADILKEAGSAKVFLFIPHGEGRGETLESIRLRQSDLMKLSPSSREFINRKLYKTEAEWLAEKPVKEKYRQILISLTKENIENYERRPAEEILREVERLDDEYYAAFPDFSELARAYGDKSGDKLYRLRDLYRRYRKLYSAEHGINVYDVTDERYSGSRRY